MQRCDILVGTQLMCWFEFYFASFPAGVTGKCSAPNLAPTVSSYSKRLRRRVQIDWATLA